MGAGAVATSTLHGHSAAGALTASSDQRLGPKGPPVDTSTPAGTLGVARPVASVQLPHVQGHFGHASEKELADVPTWQKFETVLIGCGAVVAAGLIIVCVAMRRGNAGPAA